jgi:hypothetical protein
MTSLLSPRRNRGDIDLAATEPTVLVGAEETPELPTAAWLALAAGAGVVSVLAGWVLVTGLVVSGWLAAEPGTLGQAIAVGTQLWLLANGAGATLGSATVTLIPWGLTLLIAWLVSRTAGYAARHGSAESPTVTPMVCIVATLSYLAPLLAVALVAGGPWPALRAGMVMLVVVATSAAWGCARARSSWPTGSWPAWSRAVPRAVGAALLLMLAGGAAVLAAGLAVNLDRVAALLDALGAGLVGNTALLVGQLAYAPNAVVWAACYALGPGFTLGNGSIVSPAATEIGLLPSIPMLAAVPDVGPGAVSHLWWLALGVAAGAVAATLVVLARPTARVDETSLVGGLSGVLASVAFTGVAWLTSGDLGSGLLSGLGPELVPVLVMSTSTMGLSGAICGLLLGLWSRRPRRPRNERRSTRRPVDVSEHDDEVSADEETISIGHALSSGGAEQIEDPGSPGEVATSPDTEETAQLPRPQAGRTSRRRVAPTADTDEPTQRLR